MVYSSWSSFLMPPPAPLSTVLLFPCKSRAESSIIAIDCPLQAASTSSSTLSFAGRSKQSEKHVPSSTTNRRASSQRRIKKSLLGSRSSNKASKVVRPTIEIHCVLLTTLDKKSTKTIRLLIGIWPSMNWNSENWPRKSVFKRNVMKISKKSSKSKSLSTWK